MAESKSQRLPAVKVLIKEILTSVNVTDNSEGFNHLIISNNSKIGRCNVMASILTKEEIGNIINFLIDDGTGKIIVRFFEENQISRNLQPGDVIMIVGKIRTYNAERYLSPEIVKKIDYNWLSVRKKELAERIEMIKYHGDEKGPEENSREREDFFQNEEHKLPSQKIIELIKKLDKGQGVFIEEIIEKSHLERVEEHLKRMLEKGDLFQNSPGKVKVL